MLETNPKPIQNAGIICCCVKWCDGHGEAKEAIPQTTPTWVDVAGEEPGVVGEHVPIKVLHNGVVELSGMEELESGEGLGCGAERCGDGEVDVNELRNVFMANCKRLVAREHVGEWCHLGDGMEQCGLSNVMIYPAIVLTEGDSDDDFVVEVTQSISTIT